VAVAAIATNRGIFFKDGGLLRRPSFNAVLTLLWKFSTV